MEKFYLGADIGTNSVGIACTDENYELIRAKVRTVGRCDFSTKAKRRRQGGISELLGGDSNAVNRG